jgi:hypothetical protein
VKVGQSSEWILPRKLVWEILARNAANSPEMRVLE